MKRLAILIIGCLVAVALCHAEREAVVTGHYEYHVPGGSTIEAAKLTALDRAKINAIENEFGSLVGSTSTTFVNDTSRDSSIDFLSVDEVDVKGEWIETIGEPKFTERIVNGQYVVEAEVKGRVREIVADRVNLSIKTLCNGVTSQHARTDFKDGDDLYLSFKSPVDGYVAVFLVDYTSKEVFRMLPYRNGSNVAENVNANREYVFFSIKDAEPSHRNEVDEYKLTASQPVERNDLLILFSPTPFTSEKVSQSVSADLPDALDWEEFHRWLAKMRRSNKSMQLQREVLTIRGK